MIGIPGLSIPRRRRAAASYPLLDNLVAYWNLSEASGQRNDSHSNGLHLTDNNTVTSATGPDGGTAASFAAASSEYLSRASSSALQTGDIDFTLAAWIRLASNGYRVALSKWGATGTTSNNEWVIEYDPPAKDRYALYVSAGGSVVSASVFADNFGSPALNTWHFLVAWHDSAANQIAISINNGTANTASHSAGVYAGTETFYIGGHNRTPMLSWDGRIAYVGFWKRTLTAAERTWLYNSGAGRNYAAVAAYTG